MIAVHIEVDVLHQGLESVVVCGLELLPDRALLGLDMVGRVLTVAKHISKNIDGLRYIVLEGQHMVQGELPGRVCIQLVSAVFDFGLETVPSSSF